MSVRVEPTGVCGVTVSDVVSGSLQGASQRHAEDVSSSSDAGLRLIILGYHDFSAGTLSPSQPGFALTGRVEARPLYDLYSVDGGVKLLQKQNKQSPLFEKAGHFVAPEPHCSICNFGKI